ncbi:hypothetical protein BDW02DRAFT_99399 [Decorospora gaudefroyi]|uniref:Uncharacterized protein n=1 Tax=Decorospora gaudefroyi TaxID=184978 RepID=A0A6A5K7F8_9PLEO|nr:hypothetical protein BDW02DRAFT_99399 [Decorospora gaudefroyi]
MELRWTLWRRCKIEASLPPAVTIKSWDANVASERDTENKARAHGKRRSKTRAASRSKRNLHIGGLRNPNDKPFPFFELPQEIRDQIYSCLVVRRDPHGGPVLDATTILKNRKKRLAAQKARDRVNRQRLLSGKPPICARRTVPEPILHLDLLQGSQQMYNESTDCMYSTNWFAVSLAKLPSTTCHVPDGWNLSRAKRLQLEVQVKDAIRMNRYIDWMSFFSSFTSLRFLRIIITLHPRYYEWAREELCDWQTTHYVHKAFFRELLAAIPSDIDLRIGPPTDISSPTVDLQGKTLVDKAILWDMYAELGSRNDSGGRPLPVGRVVV